MPEHDAGERALDLLTRLLRFGDWYTGAIEMRLIYDGQDGDGNGETYEQEAKAILIAAGRALPTKSD